MTPKTEAWSNELREFITECRQQRPYRARQEFSQEEEWRCRVIGGGLIPWLRDYGPRLLQERAVLADYKKWDKDPIVVATSEEPGLVAAQQILRGNSSAVLSLYPDEFERWLERRPDEQFRHHIHTWSYFADLDDETLARAQKAYPLAAGESYWLHREGTACGQLFARGGDHLWKWNGEKADLLEEAFNHWVS